MQEGVVERTAGDRYSATRAIVHRGGSALQPVEPQGAVGENPRSERTPAVKPDLTAAACFGLVLAIHSIAEVAMPLPAVVTGMANHPPTVNTSAKIAVTARCI